MSLLHVGAAILLGAVITYFIIRMYRRRSLPRGPTGLPFFGNMFQMNAIRPHETLASWADEYGAMYTIRILGSDIVVLSGYDVIQEATVSNSDAFAGRPTSFRSDYFHDNNMFISFNDFSPRWIKLKKVAMTAVKAYSKGLQRLEEISLDAIQDLLDGIGRKQGEPFDILDNLYVCMTDIMSSIVFHERFGVKDSAELQCLEEHFLSLVIPGGRGMELDMIPWLRFLPNTTLRELDDIKRGFIALYDRKLKRKRETFDGEHVECVADAFFLHKMENRDDLILSDGDIRSTVIDLVGAGVTTSSASIYSLLALCVTDPELQRHLQAEIDTNIGKRVPHLKDRSQCPYVEAAILELMRYVTMVPTSVPHKTTKDVELKGHLLPKGTQVFINLWSLHHDPGFWDAPWEYRPERFLAQDGSLVPSDHPNRRHMLMFGAGRRVCVGEVLAKNRLFLLTASLLQRFTFVSGADDNPPNADPREFQVGIVLHPQHYTVKALARDT